MDIKKIVLSHSAIGKEIVLPSIEMLVEQIQSLSVKLHSGEILIYYDNSHMDTFVFSNTEEKSLLLAIKNMRNNYES